MLRNGDPFFVDYQGGRQGALQYDIASLLYDAKADLPPDLRRQLLDHYLDSLARFIKLDREASMRHYRSEEHTSELQSLTNLVCRLLLEKKKKNTNYHIMKIIT